LWLHLCLACICPCAGVHVSEPEVGGCCAAKEAAVSYEAAQEVCLKIVVVGAESSVRAFAVRAICVPTMCARGSGVRWLNVSPPTRALQGKSTIVRRFGEIPGAPGRTVGGVEVTSIPFGPLDVRRVRPRAPPCVRAAGRPLQQSAAAAAPLWRTPALHDCLCACVRIPAAVLCVGVCMCMRACVCARVCLS
jgi:hypothetical protein